MRLDRIKSMVLLLCGLACMHDAAAQVPVEKEAHHKIVLENEWVRVLEGNVPPHDTTPSHVRAWSSYPRPAPSPFTPQTPPSGPRRAASCFNYNPPQIRSSGKNDFRRANPPLRRINFYTPLFIYIFVSARNNIQTERPEQIQSS